MSPAYRFSGPSDLHTHSSVSDGTELPGDLIASAAAAGLGTVALTDHDSTAGWVGAAEASRRLGLTLIPGMEFSSNEQGRSVHILAYLFNPTDPGILAETERIRAARFARAETIVANISRDYAISWADVVAQTQPGTTVGRPHIADALVARGFSPDRSAAFATILHPTAGYYIPHYAPSPVDVVRLIRAAGGVPVLAHPATGTRTRIVPEDKLAELVDAGLFGLEVGHRENTEAGKEVLRRYAERFGLVQTGSSDYHGEGKPNRLGENTTSDAVVQSIIDEATGYAPVYPGDERA